MANKPYSNLKCPSCGVEGDFSKDHCEEVACNHCGLVIESPYPYSAGLRFKTLVEILDDERNEEMNVKRWRKEYERIKKLQKV